MGYAAIEYFEGGADLSGLGAKLREARDKAVETAAKTRDRLTGAPADEAPIPAHAYVVAASPAEPAAPHELPTTAATPPAGAARMTQADLWPRIEQLLSRVERPARYVDREWGARHDERR